LASSITKPLNHVVELANTVASGNLDVPIEVYKSDEIGVLKAAFRTMVNEVKMLLKEKDRHLKELNLHRNHLEERVEARTAELKQSNQQLQREIKVREKAEEKQASLLKELQSVNQELKEFAYVVSHDLKAPLRAIGSLSDWLLSDYGDKLDDEGKELVNLLDSRVRRMHNLIEGVLHYSRVGRIREERRNVNLNEALRNAIEMVSPPENMEIRIESDLPVVWVGRTRIEQVFQNLVSNAVKYMDKPKGLIKISCTSDDASWKFCVADNGPGIEEKYFEKIFQIFQTLTPKDEYGGRIWLESEVGVGTSFFFTLPKMNVNVVDESEVLSECE
jgi:signal transduction histidine kinase